MNFMSFKRIDALFGVSPAAKVFFSKIDSFTCDFADKYVAFCKAYNMVPEYSVTYIKELLELKFKMFDGTMQLDNDPNINSDALF